MGVMMGVEGTALVGMDMKNLRCVVGGISVMRQGSFASRGWGNPPNRTDLNRTEPNRTEREQEWPKGRKDIIHSTILHHEICFMSKEGKRREERGF
mgnify:FL=1